MEPWIVSDPERLGGKPCIRGTRISVEFVLELLAGGANRSDILDRYPHVPAEGLDLYRNFVLKSPVDSTKWISGWELDPGNPRVVHHAILNLANGDWASTRDSEDPEPGFQAMELEGIESPGGSYLVWTPGLLASSAMVGFETRHIDGVWYEARTSDPFATYWYRRNGEPWGWSLNSSGWRAMWESLGWLDAVDEMETAVDQEPLPETGSEYRGERLDGEIVASRWLPIPGAEGKPPLFRYRTATDLQIGATLLLVGARVGFNPLEFVDFM